MGTHAKPLTQFLGIQYLRGVAALMVAYLHLSIQIPAYTGVLTEHFGANLNLGVGVDIFFAISGFIMVVSTGSATPAQFLFRRVVRVVPLYWFMTLLVVAGYLVQPAWFRSTVVSVEYVLKSLFFIPFENPGHAGDMMPVLVPGWSLNFEMAFYLVFALSLWVPGRLRLGFVGAIFLLLFVLGHLPWGTTLPREFWFYVDPRIVEFWLGMVVGSQVQASWNQRVPRFFVWVVLIGAFGLLLAPSAAYGAFPPYVAVWFGNVLPAGALVWAVVALEVQGKVPKITALQHLGDASYSIYLSHILTLGVVRMVWARLGLAQVDLLHVGAFAGTAVAASVAVGWAIFVLVERPLQHVFKTAFSKKTSV
jgi:exopolysaccharide production protein ExoZ